MDARERNQILLSWIVLGIAFAIVLSRGALFAGDFFVYGMALAISLIAVGAGFIFHELAHRQVSRHFGAHAEFRAWNFGLMLALFSSFLGFIFAAPGAVYIYKQYLSRRQNGLISIAGPLTNIGVALFFLVLFVLVAVSGMMSESFLSALQQSPNPILAVSSIANLFDFVFILSFIGSYVNFFLAFFNLLPIPPLDGSKVIAWNVFAWLAAIGFAGAMVFFVL